MNLGKAAGCLVLAMSVHAFGQESKLAQDPACQTLQPASTGGPMPKDANLMVLRYLSYSNFEIAYRGRVLLLDAYYDTARAPYAEPIPLKESEVKRADAILVGHAHADHIVDAPAIAKRTGAQVFAPPPGLKYLQKQGLPENQIKVVRGGESFKMDGYTVQTALGIHMVLPANVSEAYRTYVRAADPLTPEQQKAVTEWQKAQPVTAVQDFDDPDNDTIYHGVIVYLLTFDGGFRMVFSDTGGILSREEQEVANSIHSTGGKVDLAIIGYLADTVPPAIRATLARVKNWEPNIFLPSHFDNGHEQSQLLMPTAPLFQAFRTAGLNVRGIEPLYRSPICINTKTDEVFVGNYIH